MGPKFRGTTKAKPVSVALAKAQAKLSEAVALHQQGRLEPAKQIYVEILQGNPKHFDALHLLGVIAYQMKYYQEAADLIGMAIEINPKSAEVVFKHALMIAPWPTFSRVSSSGGYPRRCSRPRSPCIGSCRWVLCVGLPVWLCEISIQLLN